MDTDCSCNGKNVAFISAEPKTASFQLPLANSHENACSIVGASRLIDGLLFAHSNFRVQAMGPDISTFQISEELNMIKSKFFALLAMILMVFGVQSVEAQTDYKAKGFGIYTPQAQPFPEYQTFGKSNFGRLNGFGTAVPLTANNPTPWTTIGEVFEEYADGSTLSFTGEGEVEIIPLFGAWNTAVWTGTFTVTGGTGRFEDAVGGSTEVLAVNLPFRLTDARWYFLYNIQGSIEFE